MIPQGKKDLKIVTSLYSNCI